MTNFCLALRTIVALLLVSLGSGSYNRASYVFQAGVGSPPASEHEQSPQPEPSVKILIPATLAVAASPPKTHYWPRHKKSPLAGRTKATETATKLLALRLLPSLRASAQIGRPLSQRHIRQDGPVPPERYRSRGVALLLALVALFSGIYGLQRFYLGYSGHGTAYLLASLLGLFLVLIGIVSALFTSTISGFTVVGLLVLGAVFGLQLSDTIRIITGDLKPKNGVYNPGFFQVTHAATPDNLVPEQS